MGRPRSVPTEHDSQYVPWDLLWEGFPGGGRTLELLTGRPDAPLGRDMLLARARESASHSGRQTCLIATRRPDPLLSVAARTTAYPPVPVITMSRASNLMQSKGKLSKWSKNKFVRCQHARKVTYQAVSRSDIFQKRHHRQRLEGGSKPTRLKPEARRIPCRAQVCKIPEICSRPSRMTVQPPW